ncbi:MAG: 2-hydroxyacyl-CoA dehydratase [Chloroflexi bacterium]|nr:2-hydroxyacyl-CoA dehydratase [Chloroflexota bacterium]
MVTKTKVGKGLAAVNAIYKNREELAQERQKAGERVFTYFCCYTPVEILTAAGVLPFRVRASMEEPITAADTHLETNMCPFVRSCFDMALKGPNAFAEGFIVPHSCDTIDRIFNIWRYYLEPKFAYYLSLPHVAAPTNPEAYDFFAGELETFRKDLGTYLGKKITDAALRKAVDQHNQLRALQRELNELRKADPPLITGSEMTKLDVAVMSIPVTEGIDLVKSVMEEVKTRARKPAKKSARVLVWGAEMDHVAFIELVEAAGAHVVMDDLCGHRYYWGDVPKTAKPLDGISRRYLDDITCSRTYKPFPIEERFKYLADWTRDWKAKGAIFYLIRFCDAFNFDYPELKGYFDTLGIPNLYIEDAHNMTTIGQLKTRVQAFVEMLA